MIKKIEDYLVEKGLISDSQLNWAKMKASEDNEVLYKILIKEGIIQEKKYFSLLAELYGKEFVGLELGSINTELIKTFPEEILERYNFIPVEKTLDGIRIATSDPSNYFMIQEIEEMTGYKVEFLITTLSDVLRVKKEFNIFFEDEDSLGSLDNMSMKEVVDQVRDGYLSNTPDNSEDLLDYDITSTDAPVVVLVNKLILEAVKEGATDIHIECFEHNMKVRYRIDGILKKVMEIEKNAQEPVVTRLKILADLDITERFVPQDGRFKLKISEDDIDFRITFLPSMFGQNVSIRIFNKKATPLTFDEIGLSNKQEEVIASVLKRKYGLILVVGPTGSGKTTTLYTMLNKINSDSIKIITIEDPVEYRMDGVHQIPVRLNKEDEKKSLTFAKGLKAILRQDPNVIMIGEIRDKETAQIAINAALTGHLVFSTLHANTTVDVVSRLKHLGISPDLISDSLSLIIAQRLCRKKCKSCGGLENSEKKGCDFCNYTGYNGRIGVFEILRVNTDIKEIIASDMAGVFIRKQAEKEEYWNDLQDDAEKKLKDGVITTEEFEAITI